MFKYLIIVVCSSLSLLSHGYTNEQSNQPVTVVIFGATGDLSAKKLFPALYNLSNENELNENFAVVGIGRLSLSQDNFHSIVQNSLNAYSRNKPTDTDWENFRKHVVYHEADFTLDEGYKILFQRLANLDAERGVKSTHIFYLSTDSLYFPVIISKLYENNLLNSEANDARVIIEKPFGQDLNSALALQENIGQYLTEQQIYRIDHYLGKEGVKKLIHLRFEDSRLEELLHREYVTDIQLTAIESMGIGTRGGFYENTGHLRDFMQNHSMQLLGILLMDASTYNSQKKIEALQAFRPFPEDQIDQYIQRGQYAAGMIANQAVPGYLEENDVHPQSQTETFAQAKFYVDSERWSGVPIYSRSGKRLGANTVQMTLNLRSNSQGIDAITIVIQPTSQVYITKGDVTEKYPMMRENPFAHREAYENLILACINEDHRDFVPMDEVEAAWRLFTPVLDFWSSGTSEPVSDYPAGRWGTPNADHQLIAEGILRWPIILNDTKVDLLK